MKEDRQSESRMGETRSQRREHFNFIIVDGLSHRGSDLLYYLLFTDRVSFKNFVLGKYHKTEPSALQRVNGSPRVSDRHGILVDVSNNI